MLARGIFTQSRLPYPIHVFLVSQHTWHQRLGHPGREVLRHLVSNNFISCNKEKPPVLCHACQLGKHVRLPVLVDIVKSRVEYSGTGVGTKRYEEERMGSVFNVQGANEFNSFILNSGLVEVQLEGYSFTWSHLSANKMSKLDHFLVTEGFISLFPHNLAVCLDRHLLDHRPILLRDVIIDYGATPFRLYHSWLGLQGFDQMVTLTWNSIVLDDRNEMVCFKKKLQILKKEIRTWVKDQKHKQSGCINDIKSKLSDIDKQLDQGGGNDELLLSRMDLMKQMHDIKSSDARDYMQKVKIQWAIEGDENSKFFHGIINRKRANISIKGILVDGEWVDDPSRVKKEFCSHFATRFQAPTVNRSRINFRFPNRLNSDQVTELEKPICIDEIRNAVWDYGENKSPGPDGFTFEFFRKFWNLIGPDLCVAVEWFFDHSCFTKGCNSSFVSLIPKVQDPKFVSDYRPISLIGSLYKVVTKILASCLSLVIFDLISDVQTAFLLNRQILDGPFIINELLSWCKHKKQQAMMFKVDFAKAYDSIRWDYLDDVLKSFGFGPKWRSWINGSLITGMDSILINGSPTPEFQFQCGLKQGDPLAPYHFILIMESLHLSFSRVVDADIFTGIKVASSITISHLFYADDAVFIGKWSDDNLTIKWVWRFISQDNSLWYRVISSMHGSDLQKCSSFRSSTWNAIIREFWNDIWIGNTQLRYLFSRIYALEVNKICTVADKLQGSVDLSLRRTIRDRWVWDLNRSGFFRVKDVRNLLDESFLPKDATATRWIKYMPIKINVFSWMVSLDRLPTRLNLERRNVQVPSLMCPICNSALEDTSHLLFSCGFATDVVRLVAGGT
ncbi:RNA-directed DNA polymerase, eukaryota [Tanacetum coccineum]